VIGLVQAVTTAAIGGLAWVYAGYPIAAAIAGRVRPVRLRDDGAAPSRVTVGLAVHNEESHVESRVANALGQDVPFEIEVIVASDGSDDGTADLVRAIASADRRVRLLELPRIGQTAAQNEILAAATGDVVVLSDAETIFAPSCLARLVAPFDDLRVGCTTGRLSWREGESTATGRDEGAYWRYEQWVRGVESRAGWLTAVTGAILAVRRSSAGRVSEDVSADHVLPLQARARGELVLVVGDALASDRVVATPETQFRNRSRTATRGIRANASMLPNFPPWRRPSAFVAIVSHKLLRWATPWLLGIAFAGSVVLVIAGSTAYLVVVVPCAAGLVLGTIGLATGSGSRIVALPASVLVVCGAFLVGWLNVGRGRRITVWLPGTSEGFPSSPDSIQAARHESPVSGAEQELP
jgi:cellulose synthase/poly-beta-1,6-N-acetylglucosamine synthase-like glycosyltransferase